MCLEANEREMDEILRASEGKALKFSYSDSDSALFISFQASNMEFLHVGSARTAPTFALQKNILEHQNFILKMR